MYSTPPSDADGAPAGRPAGSGARSEADASTRDRVLQLVVEQGPISAAALGRTLDLTAAAVRRHLDVMTEQGMVEVKNVTTRRKGAGRPSRRYVVSQRGQQSLGDDYLALVRNALELMGQGDSAGSATEAPATEAAQAHAGRVESGATATSSAVPGSTMPSSNAADDASEDGPSSVDPARQLASTYFSQFEERYRQELSAIEDLDERTERLSELFNADGFAGFTRLVGRDSAQLAMQSTQLCQGHCPVVEIAAEHPVFCEEETEMIGRLLDVDVRRLSTQAAGAHVCTTHVPVGRERHTAQRRSTSGAEQSEAGASPQRIPGPRKRIVISPRQQERFS
ncbi:MAG TPA: helix-turn-helix domain-containing protein [Candidatus Nesterenkonia stercoripullorum]|uniref:Helix-turn-helix domain-containing protein n=1 Tax=Candidatus Nesterenkonia stercoripullorum TaxID=2838701 RepID=A0A9D1RZY5_9MICC|nr:helix-turn-helix domain-containing protein [Candidatus Nesterenkonia stercoripullorum]